MIDPIFREFNILNENRQKSVDNTMSLITNLKNNIKNIKDAISNNNSNNNDNNILVENSINTNQDQEKFKVENVLSIIKQIDKEDILKNYNQISNFYYNSLTKFGKCLSTELENCNEFELTNNFELNKNNFVSILIKDLYRKGNFKTADSLVLESKTEFNNSYRFLFNDLNAIKNDLKKGVIDTLLKWIEKYNNELESLNSDIRFQSVILRIVILNNKYIKDNNNNNTLNKLELIKEAKTLLKEFINDIKYTDRISKVMTLLTLSNKSCLLSNNTIMNNKSRRLSGISNSSNCVLNKIDNSNEKLNSTDYLSIHNKSIFSGIIKDYEEYNYNNLLDKIIDTFTRDCCNILSKTIIFI